MTMPAADCTTMAEVRAGVDALDRALAALLGRRFAYMDAAARIKTERGAVRDEARKAAVIAQAESGSARGRGSGGRRGGAVGGAGRGVDRLRAGGLRPEEWRE